MAQFARPSSDAYVGAWTNQAGSGTNLYQSVDESVTSPNDADYVQSESAPASSPVVFALSAVTDPLSSTGHIVRWRRGKDLASGAQIDLTVEIRQGYVSEASKGTLIATVTDTNIPDSQTTTTYTLTGAEADAITNYAALFVRIVANQP